MANAKNSELGGCFQLDGVKYGDCADDQDATVPDEVQEVLKEKGFLNVERAEGGLFDGLDDSIVGNLEEAGYGDRQAINGATDKELQEVDGIGPKWAQTLKARAGVGTGQDTPPEEEDG
jgi:hypothetical protein